VPRDFTESEFVNLVSLGDAAFPVDTVIYIYEWRYTILRLTIPTPNPCDRVPPPHTLPHKLRHTLQHTHCNILNSNSFVRESPPIWREFAGYLVRVWHPIIYNAAVEHKIDTHCNTHDDTLQHTHCNTHTARPSTHNPAVKDTIVI